MYECGECLVVASCESLCDKIEEYDCIPFDLSFKCPDCGSIHFKLQKEPFFSNMKSVTLCSIHGLDLDLCKNSGKGCTSIYAIQEYYTPLIKCYLCRHIFEMNISSNDQRITRKYYMIDEERVVRSDLDFMDISSTMKQISTYLKKQNRKFIVK